MNERVITHWAGAPGEEGCETAHHECALRQLRDAQKELDRVTKEWGESEDARQAATARVARTEDERDDARRELAEAHDCIAMIVQDVGSLTGTDPKTIAPMFVPEHIAAMRAKLLIERDDAIDERDKIAAERLEFARTLIGIADAKLSSSGGPAVAMEWSGGVVPVFARARELVEGA